MTRTIAIGLKIPDNAAYTALTTLQRLGIDVARVERNDILVIDDAGDGDLLRRIERDERIFNPNKHRLTDLGIAEPRPGEVWIAAHDAPAGRYVGWRLLDRDGVAVGRETLERATVSLLCNPATETARYESREGTPS